MTGSPRGMVLVISGPSGVGKTTVVNLLLEDPAFGRAVTATTRSPRTGELDGVHYHFRDEAEFRAGIERGDYLEHAEVHGRLYGTPRSEVDRVLDAGKVCVLNIDVQGAATLRAAGLDALFVFLAPPNDTELARRLRSRGTDSEEDIQRRLAGARAEMAWAASYDQVVKNDNLERVIDEITGLVRSRWTGNA